MKKIHEFDSELRRAVESGGHGKGVVFIQKDNDNKIIPCSPNKIMLSSITMLKPHKRMLPFGFQTGYKTNIQSKIDEIDVRIRDAKRTQENKDAIKIPVKSAKDILSLIHSTLIMEEGYDWNLEEYFSILDYLAYESDSENQGFVWLITREDRNIKRLDKKKRFEDSPDTPKGIKGELKIAREFAMDIPSLILLRQNGLAENGWRGTPFWWPVLVAPKETIPTVFAKKTIK